MTKFIETNGIQLAYDEQGSGKKTLILMHGITANRHSFDGLIRAGVANNYRVIRVDLRGRGETAMPAKGYHMRDHAADIWGMMDALAIEKPILVGHSFGGLLAVFMAAQHPERLEKIIIIDAAKEATTPETVEKIRPSLNRLRVPVPDIDAAMAMMEKMPYFADGSWTDEIDGWYRSELAPNGDGTYRRLVYADGIMEAIEGILGEDWAAHFRGAKVPCLLIHAPAPFVPNGAPIVTEDGAKETLALLPDSNYVRVSGHHITMVFGDHAQEVVNAIENFAG